MRTRPSGSSDTSGRYGTRARVSSASVVGELTSSKCVEAINGRESGDAFYGLVCAFRSRPSARLSLFVRVSDASNNLEFLVTLHLSVITFANRFSLTEGAC